MTKAKKEQVKGSKLFTKKTAVIAAIIFGVALTIFIITLAPVSTTEDTGEFIIGAYTLSIMHPPGYPLYCLLGKLFTLIPIGSIGWRVNLMSAFFGALTAAAVYLFAYKSIKSEYKHFIGAAVALAFVFSSKFWSQAVIAEVYTLYMFLLVVGLILIAQWQKDRSNKWLYIFALIYGLSVTNHHIMIGMAPIYALYFLIIDWRIIKKVSTIIKMFFLSLVPLVLYAYLPIRSKMNPFIDWGNPETWDNFVYHFLRKQYGGTGLSHVFNGEAWTAKIQQISDFFTIQLPEQFSAWLLILAVIGMVYALKKAWRETLVVVAIFIAFSIGYNVLIVYKTVVPLESHLISVFYIPSYFALIYLMGWGCAAILNFLQGKWKKLPWKYIAALVLLMPAIIGVSNFTFNDHRNDYISYDQATIQLQALEEDAIFIIHSDTFLRNIWYKQVIENARPDVITLMYTSLFSVQSSRWLSQQYPEIAALDRLPTIDFTDLSREEIEELEEKNFVAYLNWLLDLGRPVYVDTEGLVPSGFDFKPARVGIATQVVREATDDEYIQAILDGADRITDWQPHKEYNQTLYQNDLFQNSIANNTKNSLYVLAAAYVYQGDYDKAYETLRFGQQIYPLAEWDEGVEEVEIQPLLSMINNVDSAEAHFDYAWKKVGRVGSIETTVARREFHRVLELDAEHGPSYFGIALSYLSEEEYTKSIENFKIAFEKQPALVNDFISFINTFNLGYIEDKEFNDFIAETALQ